MKIIRTKNYEELSKRAADVLAAQVILKPDCVLGLATGSTPIGAYDELARRCAAGELDFSAVRTVNLDEYKGMPRENEQSYYYFMNQHLFSRVNIDPKNTHLPHGMELDDAKETARYEQLIEDLGGIDMQLLGIGHNGHIGFNEPNDEFVLNVNCVKLTQRTIEANKRFFASADEVPKEAYTMGMRNIMLAKRILLVISGEDKAEILKEMLTGPVTPRVPASILRLHADVTLVADEAALSKLG